MNADVTRSFFESSFGATAKHVASAPARVNLIGEHTDYNGGEVLPIGIDRRTYVAVRARATGEESRAASSTHEGIGTFSARHPVKSGEWWDYIAGVVQELRESGADVPPLEIAVTSDVPAGAGLSSSAAIAVASALAIGDLIGLSMPLQQAAELAWRGETRFVGMPCGIMDQFASALATERTALHLWCDTKRTEHVRCDESLLIFDTGVSRGLRSSAFATRRDECVRALAVLQRRRPELTQLAHATRSDVEQAELDPVLRARATHVVEENARVRDAVAELAASGTIPGALLVASHASLRDLYDCSCPELDWFVDHALEQPGIRGARLTGAGWGGCAIATGAPEALESAMGGLEMAYSREFSRGSRSWLVRPSAGARVEK
jgi:galactokinase